MNSHRRFNSSVRSCLGVAIVLSFQTLSPFAALSAQQPSGAAPPSLRNTPSDVWRLDRGTSVEREIAMKEVHTYTIELAAGQFVEAVVDQRGISIGGNVVGPEGKVLPYSPVVGGTRGPEHLVFIAESAGTYRIDLFPDGRMPASGRYMVTVEKVGQVTERERDLVEASELQAKADASYNPNPQRQLIADATLGTGSNARPAEPRQDPVVLIEQALALRERALGPDHPSVAWTTIKLASMRLSSGPADEQMVSVERSIAVLEKAYGPNHRALVDPITQLASMFQIRGDAARGQGLIERTLAIEERNLGPDHPELCIVLQSLASLYAADKNYKRAVATYRRAVPLAERLDEPDSMRVIFLLQSWAAASAECGADGESEAIPLLERSVAIIDKTIGQRGFAFLSGSLPLLARLYDRKSESAKADAIRLRIRAVDESMAAMMQRFDPNFVNTAMEFVQSGDFSSAREVLEKGIARRDTIAPELTFFFMVAHEFPARLLLMQLYRASGDDTKAEEMFERIAPHLGTSPYLAPYFANCLTQAALVSRARGDLAGAVDRQKRANDDIERRTIRALTLGSARQKLARRSLFMSTAEFDCTLSLHIDSAPLDPSAARLALESILRTKGRSLDAMADSIGLLRSRALPDDRKLLDLLQEAEGQLASTVLKGGNGDDPARLATLENAVEDLEARVSARSAEFRAAFEPVTIDAVQRAVPEAAALIEFAAYRPVDPRASSPDTAYGPSRYAAYVLEKTGVPRVADLGPANLIDASIDRLRTALQDPRRSDASRLAREVDELVMRPVRELLGTERHLLIAPDGQLNLVPFAALVDERNRYLVEDYTITYLTSGRDLLRPVANEGGNSAPVVIADPDFGSAVAMTGAQREITHEGAGIEGVVFAPLPGTADEAQAVGRTLKGAKLLTRGGATETAVKALSRPRVLHVATHGFFLKGAEPPVADARSMMTDLLPDTSEAPVKIENPLLRSGLALAGANAHKSGGDDGILTAMEVAGLDLYETELVVLSACKTGVGEVRAGEGVYGLRRALVLAGSESQVMTLWSVSDRATRDLMVAYYRRLMTGEGRAEALRHVQLAMLRSRNRSHPYFWAGVIQSGQWGPLEKP